MVGVADFTEAVDIWADIWVSMVAVIGAHIGAVGMFLHPIARRGRLQPVYASLGSIEMSPLLLILIIILLFGGLGGGYYGYNSYGTMGGIVPIILVLIVVFFLFGRGGW
jgi:hypothetical protein